MSKLVKNPALNIEVVQPGNIWLYRNGLPKQTDSPSPVTSDTALTAPHSSQTVPTRLFTIAKPQPKSITSPPPASNTTRPIFEFIAALNANEFLIQGEDKVIYKASKLS
jgi:hypothetical protein